MFTQLFAPNLGLFQHYLVIFVLMNELSIKQNLAEEEKEEEEDDIEESEEEESEDESEGKAVSNLTLCKYMFIVQFLFLPI